MTRADPQMKIRLPDDLRDRIAELAKANGRSMNAEIVARLQSSVDGEGSEMISKAEAERLNGNMVALLDALEAGAKWALDGSSDYAKRVEEMKRRNDKNSKLDPLAESPTKR
ncbi:Arc family DNA-binding protein [Methylobacterium soli]|uniref:Arc family DNA-binding protein n=2 Tax=Methylobacterium soli TaxID=553447 RepID=A0A6L3T8I5_9HYPH|nr:Arc family DNA-binding protein [Methylobacterium soli]